MQNNDKTDNVNDGGEVIKFLKSVFVSKSSKELQEEIENELLEEDPQEATLIISKNKINESK